MCVYVYIIYIMLMYVYECTNTGCPINLANFKMHLATRKIVCITFISSNPKSIHMNVLLYLSFHFFFFKRC